MKNEEVKKTLPGNPDLEKMLDDDKKKGKETEIENPDEKYSDENKEKGIGKDMNNREREAEKIQEEEDTKNDKMEIEQNKKL